jgi:hypothetical protein
MIFQAIIIKRVTRDINSDLDLIDVDGNEARQIVASIVGQAVLALVGEEQPIEECDVKQYAKLDEAARSFLPADIIRKIDIKDGKIIVDDPYP